MTVVTHISSAGCPSEDTYGLEAQIHHKVAFIRDHTPPDVSLILIGHSIGCYMILNLLEHLDDSKVERGFLLFPTVERMAESPNGKRMTPVFRYLRWLVVLVALFLSLLPESLCRSIISFHFKNSDCPPCFIDGVLRTVRPWTVNFSTYLAKIEMKVVDALQKHLVRKFSHKLSYYYGASDDWAPKEYFYEMKTVFPDADIRLCENNYKHAFIQEMKEGRAMAAVVESWCRVHQCLV